MAITKEIIVDKVEVVGQYNALQIKYKTRIKEDDKIISESVSREAFDCGTITGDDNTWVDTDVSAKDQKIKDIAGAVWTSTEKDALKAKLIADKS
jgi:hypothetical protein|tara:strand:+ start:530 stop:814 length:285 start_codon:yes stop_codon:yes gene_type:complete